MKTFPCAVLLLFATTSLAGEHLERIFDTLPPVPENPVEHGKRAIEGFERECWRVYDRLGGLLNQEQAGQEEIARAAMDRMAQQAKIYARMAELSDKGELTEEKAAEMTRQAEQYEIAPQSTAGRSSQNDEACRIRMEQFGNRFRELLAERHRVSMELPIIKEVDELEARYRQAQHKGEGVARARTDLARGCKERRRIFSGVNAECLRNMQRLIRDNWSFLEGDPSRLVFFMRQYVGEPGGFYSFFKIGQWERYLDGFGLKESDIIGE